MNSLLQSSRGQIRTDNLVVTCNPLLSQRHGLSHPRTTLGSGLGARGAIIVGTHALVSTPSEEIFIRLGLARDCHLRFPRIHPVIRPRLLAEAANLLLVDSSTSSE